MQNSDISELTTASSMKFQRMSCAFACTNILREKCGERAKQERNFCGRDGSENPAAHCFG